MSVREYRLKDSPVLCVEDEHYSFIEIIPDCECIRQEVVKDSPVLRVEDEHYFR